MNLRSKIFFLGVLRLLKILLRVGWGESILVMRRLLRSNYLSSSPLRLSSDILWGFCFSLLCLLSEFRVTWKVFIIDILIFVRGMTFRNLLLNWLRDFHLFILFIPIRVVRLLFIIIVRNLLGLLNLLRLWLFQGFEAALFVIFMIGILSVGIHQRFLLLSHLPDLHLFFFHLFLKFGKLVLAWKVLHVLLGHWLLQTNCWSRHVLDLLRLVIVHLWSRLPKVVKCGACIELWFLFLFGHLRIRVFVIFINLRGVLINFLSLLLRHLVELDILRNLLIVNLGYIFLWRLLFVISNLTIWLLVFDVLLSCLLGSSLLSSLHHSLCISNEVLFDWFILLTVITIEGILVVIQIWRLIFKNFLFWYFGGVLELITHIWGLIIRRANFSGNEFSLMINMVLTMAILLLGKALELLMEVVLRSFVLKNLFLLFSDGILNNALYLTGIFLTQGFLYLKGLFSHLVLLLSLNNLLDLNALFALINIDRLLILDHDRSLLWVDRLHVPLIEWIHWIFSARILSVVNP